VGGVPAHAGQADEAMDEVCHLSNSYQIHGYGQSNRICDGKGGKNAVGAVIHLSVSPDYPQILARPPGLALIQINPCKKYQTPCDLG